MRNKFFQFNGELIWRQKMKGKLLWNEVCVMVHVIPREFWFYKGFENLLINLKGSNKLLKWILVYRYNCCGMGGRGSLTIGRNVIDVGHPVRRWCMRVYSLNGDDMGLKWEMTKINQDRQKLREISTTMWIVNINATQHVGMVGVQGLVVLLASI